MAGSLPNDMPYGKEKFDVIFLLDVLEHVKEDKESLITIHNMLTDTGKLVLSVPACQFLWSQHDTLNHYYRRYSKTSLQQVAKVAKLQISFVSYFNFFLFPIVYVVRLCEKFSSKKKLQTHLEAKLGFFNWILYKVFAFEKYFL